MHAAALSVVDQAIFDHAQRDPKGLRHILEKSLCEDHLADFCRTFWPVLEPVVKLKWGWALDAMCIHLEAVSNDEINNLGMNVPPGMMKPICSDVEVLTLDGFKRHGDLRAGDYVYSPSGHPVRIIATSEERMEPSCRLGFDDGSSIIAGVGHDWDIERCVQNASSQHKRIRRKMIVRSDEIKVGDRADRISLSGPIVRGLAHDLPIDPYLFGLWLGDGATDSGALYGSKKDIELLKPYGEPKMIRDDNKRGSAFYRVTPKGLGTHLRIHGLKGNKHVPMCYLLARADQRLALLQGLLDTDGHCDKNGLVTFTNKNKAIADAALFLARSLGMKARQSSRMTELNGVMYGPHYKVSFRSIGQKLFRLKRKQERVIPASKPRTRHRYVKTREDTGNRLMRCIQVEGGRYLVGRALIPTHNSLLTAVFWPSWEWGPRNMPHLRYVLTSYKEGLATRDNMKARRLIRSTKYRDMFGDRFSLSKLEKDTQNEYHTDATGFRFCVGARGGVTGYRGDRIIIDDPHSVQGAESEAERLATVEWFTNELYNRVNDPETAKRVLIMQRIHEADISGHIKETLSQDWEWLTLPMRFENPEPEKTVVLVNNVPTEIVEVPEKHTTSIGFTDPRTEEGELLFDERFPASSVDSLERGMMSFGGEYSVAGQMQQRPAPKGGGMFKVIHIEIVDSVPDNLIQCRGWDFAGSVKKTSPFTAGVKGGLGLNDDLYITDVRRIKKKIYDAEQEIVATVKLDTAAVLQSMPQDPGSAGKSQVDKLSREMTGYVYIFSPEQGSKEDRALPLAAHCNVGHMKILRAPWNKAYLAEFKTFPRGKFMDQVDATSRMFNQLLKMPRAMTGGDFDIELLDNPKPQAPHSKPKAPLSTGVPIEDSDMPALEPDPTDGLTF